MNSRELDRAIKFLRPNAEFAFVEAYYESIQWHILEGEAPTLADVENAHKLLTEQDAKAAEDLANKKKLLLDKLGLSEAEAKIILS